MDVGPTATRDVMLRILARRHIQRLAEFAASNVLVAFDFDGTLAPLATRPSAARMRPSTRRLLVTVARLYPVIVISGRSRADLVRRVGGVPVWHLAGNHGLEPWATQPDYPRLVSAWARQMRALLAGQKGILVENKVYSLTVHYREATGRMDMAALVQRAARRLQGARIVRGRDALSLVPRGAPDKGVALERARRLLACDTAIYVGDDDTDEDAFTSADPHRLLGIRVGATRRSAATYCISSQDEIDPLLAAIIDLRRSGRLAGPVPPKGATRP